jgi:hypothetical protein
MRTGLGRRTRGLTALGIGLALGAIFTMPAATGAGGQCSQVVTNLNDSGPGSLRDAVVNVCAGGTITFSVTGTIQLSSGYIDVGHSLTIQGPGADQLTLRHNSSSQSWIMRFRNITANVSGVTFADGSNVGGGGEGAAIYNEGGTLTIDGVAFVNNHADYAGALMNTAGPTSGAVVIRNSTFSDNVASFSGAALYHSSPNSLTIVNSTFSHNQAGQGGGAIYVGNAGLSILNSTITNNYADVSDTGFYSGGGISAPSQTAILWNTIVAGNYHGIASPVADDVSATLDGSSASNLIGVDTGLSGVSNGVNGNQVGTAASPLDPGLGPLANNGGPTQTHALAAGSPALDAGDNSLISAYTTDQRGYSRIVDGPDPDVIQTVDIGAVEQDPSMTHTPDQSGTEDTPLVLSFGVGEGTTDCTAIGVASSNAAVVLSDSSHLQLASGGAPTCTLTITPQPNANGTTTITVTVPASAGGPAVTTSDTFNAFFAEFPDAPMVSNATTFVNQQTTSGLVVAENVADGPEITGFEIDSISGGTLFLNDGLTQVANGGSITPAQGAAGLKFTPDLDSTAFGLFVAHALDGVGNSSTGTLAVIAVNKHTTYTYVTVPPPDPSDRLANVAVNLLVQSADGPVPTGSVTVTIDDGTGATCTATLVPGGSWSTGTCTLNALSVPGLRTVTGTYNGDTYSATSVGTASHTVSECPKTPVVTNTDDSGAGSLRQAIADACTTDTITFDLPGPGPDTIAVSSVLWITGKHLTITGPTSKRVILSGNNAGDIAEIDYSAGATFVNLTLSDGTGPQGGAILSYGDLVVADSTLSGNSSVGGGGALQAIAGTLAIYNSTLSGNSAPDQGAAIRTLVPTVVVNSTIAANTGRSAITFFNPLTLYNSIVAGNSLTTPGDLLNAGGGSIDPSSAFNLIGDGTFTTITNGTNGNQVGTTASPIDPKIGPLQDNGGPTFTHALLANSPAYDAGSNGLAGTYNLTTDQRGAPRVVQGPDADPTATVDIGAYEARASLSFSDITTLEDTPISGGFLAGDPALITSVTMVSGNTAIVPNDGAAIVLNNNAPGAWQYGITPIANQFGSVPLTVTVTTPNEVLQTIVTLAVGAVANTPSVTNATTDEDVQTASGLVLSRNAVDGAEVTHFKITGITNGTLYQNDGLTAIGENEFITFAQGNAGLKFTPSPNFFGTASFHAQASVSNVDAGLGGGVVTATITVNPVPDAPVMQNYLTDEDTPVTTIVIARNPADGAEVTHFQITGISGGTMTLGDGTPIHDGDFIAADQPSPLHFIPAPNFFGNGLFAARGAIGASTANMGPIAGSVVIIVPIADPPLVLPATTRAQIQTASGLVISRNPVDGAEVTHFQISLVANGALYQHDGVTPIADNEFITVAQGNAGLRFTPSDGFTGVATFNVNAATSALGAGLSPTVQATVTVTKHDTATTITSHDPNPSDQGTTLTVKYGVSDTTGGPAPTGSVTVTVSGGTETCTATVAAGQCSFTLTSGGTGRTITASYGGDSISNVSTGTALHDVKACPANPVVTTTADSGSGSLRQALLDACNSDTVTFAIPGTGPQTITLTSGPLTTNKDLLIVGSFDTPIRISGNHAGRVFDVTSSTLGLLGLTVMDGSADLGGGIRTTGGIVLLASTVSGNAATLGGGGVFGDGPASSVTIMASTISGNSAPTGSAVRADGPFSIAETTITANTGGGAAILNADPTSIAANSIITGNDGPAVSNTGAGAFADAGGNLLTGDPMLGPLQDNGGITFTHLPLPGSPAIGGGDLDNLVDLIDQRGFPRLAGRNADPFPALDIGAVEVVPTVDAVPAATTPANTSIAVPFAVGDSFIDVAARTVTTPPFDSIVATSSDQSVVADANLVVTGTGENRTLTITPASNHAGTVVVTIAATAKILNAFANLLTPTSIPVTTTSSFTLTVTPLPTTTAVATSGTPSDQGQSVTFTATVSPATAVGTVQFMDGAVAIGSPVPVVSGVAALGTTSLSAGQHAISAVFSGSAAYVTSTGTLAGGQFVRAANGITVTSSANPSIPDEPVTIQAAVTSSTPGTPTGSITFSEGATTLATVTLTSGAATFTTSALILGTHHLTIAYSGDGTFAAATVMFDQTVGGGRAILTGADAGGGPHVRRFNALDGGVPTFGALTSFFAFDPLFAGGVRVAEGDVNGDGVPDQITVAGAGGQPEIRIFDGKTGVQIASIMAFEPSFRGGLFVAAGDVDGDGLADVIVGSGPGRSGEVKVFRDGTPFVLRDTFPFGAGFTGGVRVAAGDVNGDGYADLVVGTGPGVPAQVKVLSGLDVSVLRSMSPYPGFPGGVWVAAGDVTGDGFADVVTGAGEGGGPHVRVFDGVTGAETLGFFAYDPAFPGGVRVAVGDANGDGHADIMTAPGPGGGPDIRVFDGVTGVMFSEQMPYASGFTGGEFIATNVPLNRLWVDVPGPGATVHGPFTVSGWAFEENAADEGIDAIHVWALPVGAGAPQFLGVATIGVPRPDVAWYFSMPQRANAGFKLDGATLPPGTYDLMLAAHSRISGTFNIYRIVRIVVAP